MCIHTGYILLLSVPHIHLNIEHSQLSFISSWPLPVFLLSSLLLKKTMYLFASVYYLTEADTPKVINIQALLLGQLFAIT